MQFGLNLIFNCFPLLSEYFELPQDQIRIMFCWLSSIPLGFLMRKIKVPLHRHIYALTLGLLLSYIQVQNQILITLIPSFIAYLMIKSLGKKSDWPVFGFLFFVLTLCNGYRYIYDFYGWNLDGSISLMVLICKMTYISFHYCDGRLDKLPNLLEYFSYIYFFPTSFMGPVFDLNVYREFIHLEGRYKENYSTTKIALKNMSYGIIYLFLLTTLEPRMHPRIHYFQEPFKSYSIVTKLGYIFIVGFIQRFRYFGGWRFAQGGIDSTGLTYNGKDSQGQNQFDRVLLYKWNYELEYNPIKKTECWNTNTQEWLKSVFYDRFMMYKISPQIALLFVFIISAVWHGIHPAYYIGFAQWAALNDISKSLYRARHKFEWIPKSVKYVVLQILGQLAFTQAGTIMNVLDMYKVFELYEEFYYIPIYAPFALMILLKVTGFGRTKRTSRKQKQEEENKVLNQQNNNNTIQQSKEQDLKLIQRESGDKILNLYQSNNYSNIPKLRNPTSKVYKKDSKMDNGYMPKYVIENRKIKKEL